MLYTRESGSDINLDPEHEVIMKSNNGAEVVFRASDTSSKNSSGTTGQKGIKVEGDIWATNDIVADGKAKLGADSILAATPSVDDNSTKIATTAYVDRQVDEGTPNNRLRIKMFPADFKRSQYVYGSGSALDMDTSQSVRYLASYDIPNGYKVTHITVSGNDTDFTIFRNDLVDDSSTVEATGQSNVGTFETVELTNHIIGSDTSYCTVRVTDGGGSGLFYGGFLTLAKA